MYDKLIVTLRDTHPRGSGYAEIANEAADAIEALLPRTSADGDDNEDTSIGGVTWHSSEKDGGPDVGISVYLGKDDRLWAGEISRRTLEERGDNDFDDDSGWFLVRFVGKEVKIIAKFGDENLHAQEFMEQVAAWVRATAGGGEK
jgi:hypothetical protein